MDGQMTPFSWAVNLKPFPSIKLLIENKDLNRKQRNQIAVRPDKVLAKMGYPEEYMIQ